MAIHPLVEQFVFAITEMCRIHEESWINGKGWGKYTKDEYESAVEACNIAELPQAFAYLLFLLFEDMNDVQEWAKNPNKEMAGPTKEFDPIASQEA